MYVLGVKGLPFVHHCRCEPVGSQTDLFDGTLLSEGHRLRHREPTFFATLSVPLRACLWAT